MKTALVLAVLLLLGVSPLVGCESDCEQAARLRAEARCEENSYPTEHYQNRAECKKGHYSELLFRCASGH